MTAFFIPPHLAIFRNKYRIKKNQSMEKIMTLDQAVKFIRKHADSKLTVYRRRKGYKNRLVTIKYYSKSEGKEFASVDKIYRVPQEARIYDSNFEYTFTFFDEKKVRPL
ncbi:MAG: hypothetical protein RL641_477 [Candidatus Parcubacteria bacterium]|jgi:hypothetical protein